MPYIRVKTGPHKGKIFEIRENVITIGRDETQTIQILDQGVSRQHSEIFQIGEMCFVRDLNSTNGTFVNHQRVTEEVLKVDDELLIGTTILVFEDKARGEGSEGGVDLEGEEEEPFQSTTVELKLGDADTPKVVGKEVYSRNLTVTAELGRIMRSGKNFDAILSQAVDHLANALEASQGYLFIHDPRSGKLLPQAVVEKGKSEERKISRTIVKRVLATGMPLLTSDATVDERFALSESIVLNRIRSVICAPLTLQDRVEGLLYFHKDDPDDTFGEADLELAASGALHLMMAMANQRVDERTRRGFVSTVGALVSAMEIVDPKNQGHAERVADYSTAVGRQLGLGENDLHRLRLAALLHDVGKLAVHHSVVGVRKDQLREQHVYAGEKIINQIEGLEEILPAVRFHHERADGSGFPYKMTNEHTPLPARVLIVTNAFDNECSKGGVGGRGLPVKDVLKDMAERGGKQFDDDVIKSLLICHRNGTLYSGTHLLPT